MNLCVPEKKREEGRLVHWYVTSAACWIEVLRPADFNPNSLRNREQVPAQTPRGKRESDRRKKEHYTNQSQEISGAILQLERQKREDIKHFIFAFQSHACFPSLPFPLFVLNLFTHNLYVWPNQACLRTELAGP